MACPPGEHHVLGLIAFDLVLRDLGWNVTYLGHAASLATVQQAADAVCSDVIALWASAPDILAAVAPDIAELADRRRLVVGGPACARSALPLLAPHMLDGDVLTAALRLTATRRVPEPAAA